MSKKGQVSTTVNLFIQPNAEPVFNKLPSGGLVLQLDKHAIAFSLFFGQSKDLLDRYIQAFQKAKEMLE
jgi:hypothetical protein